MNNIQIFENKEFGAIRTMSDEQGEPLFCGKDVARALGYKNPEKALRVHIEADDKVVNKMDTTYGIKPTTFVNESGLYSLILSSKLESAKRFKHWVTSEVLPSIRKQGGYMVAKGMGMTANELNRILCQKHIQYRQSGQYLLYAPFTRQGLAQNRTRTFRDLFGAVHTTTQLVWTERGRQFIQQLVNSMSDERLATNDKL